MKFPHSMIIRFVTDYDDFGSPETYEEEEFACFILKERKRGDGAGGAKRNRYDMRILVNARVYFPYSIMFEDTDSRCVYDGKTYEIIENNQINSFSGKPRYYEMGLRQE